MSWAFISGKESDNTQCVLSEAQVCDTVLPVTIKFCVKLKVPYLALMNHVACSDPSVAQRLRNVKCNVYRVIDGKFEDTDAAEEFKALYDQGHAVYLKVSKGFKRMSTVKIEDVTKLEDDGSKGEGAAPANIQTLLALPDVETAVEEVVKELVETTMPVSDVEKNEEASEVQRTAMTVLVEHNQKELEAREKQRKELESQQNWLRRHAKGGPPSRLLQLGNHPHGQDHIGPRTGMSRWDGADAYAFKPTAMKNHLERELEDDEDEIPSRGISKNRSESASKTNDISDKLAALGVKEEATEETRPVRNVQPARQLSVVHRKTDPIVRHVPFVKPLANPHTHISDDDDVVIRATRLGPRTISKAPSAYEQFIDRVGEGDIAVTAKAKVEIGRGRRRY